MAQTEGRKVIMGALEDKIKYNVNERLVNFIVLLIGILATIIGVFLHDNKDASTILISVGASLVASAIVTYLSSIYIYKRKKEKELIDYWGITSIYKTRQEMNRSCEEHMQQIEKQMDIIAFGLRSFRDSQGKFIKSKIKNGLKLRILTIDPNSEFLRQREMDEKKTEGSIKDSINQLIQWADEINKELKKQAVEIRIYNALPLDFYFREDDYCFVGPYQYGKDSQQTISYEFHKKGKGFSYYQEYFEDLWNDRDFCKDTALLKSK